MSAPELPPGPCHLRAVFTAVSITGHLPDSMLGDVIAYAYTVATTNPPAVCDIASGALPTGLAMDSDGAITGQVTAPGDYAWTVKATDAHGYIDLHDDACTVANMTISGHLLDGPIGQVVSYQYTVSGGVLPSAVSIASGALPAGLSISASGLVTGTRTTSGNYTWTVRATDADGSFVDLVDSSITLDTYMYVSHSTQNKVYVLQKSSGSLLATIPVGITANGVAINPAGTRVYVANASANTVSVIDTATNAVIATIPVGTNPIDICVSKDGTRGYTANQSSSTVSVLDLATNTPIATIAKGSSLIACNTNPVNGDVYVVSGGNSKVYLLNADGSTKASVSATNPSGVAASPDGLHFYVVGYSGLTAFDATTHANLGNINLRGGYGPQDVEITPDGKTAYVCDYNYTDLKVVNVTNKSSMTVITSIPAVGLSKRIAMDDYGIKAYVATAVGTVAIDVATNTIETTYPYGNFGIAVGLRSAP